MQQIHAMYIGGPKDEGTTELDDIDVRLYVKLSDGDTIVVKYPDYTIEPFIIKPGKNILTVWFAGKSQTFEVEGFEKEGYIFEGWYTQAEGGIQVTSATLAQADATYYAH